MFNGITHDHQIDDNQERKQSNGGLKNHTEDLAILRWRWAIRSSPFFFGLLD
jgi:hypothetical protein